MSDALWIDVRHSLRRLRKSPGLSAVVVTTIALAIGANTAVFSLVNGIILRPITARDPAGLVSISSTDARTGRPLHAYAETMSAFGRQQGVFSGMALYTASVVRAEIDGGSRYFAIEGVTPEYFEVAGTRLSEGRFLTDDDMAAAATGPVAVIAAVTKRRVFGDATSALGKTLTIDGAPFTVVGVLGDDFRGMQRDSGSEAFVPLPFARPADPPGILRGQRTIARLASGISLAEAQAEVLGRWPAIQSATLDAVPEGDRSAVADQTLAVESLARGISGAREQWGSALLVTIGLSAVLLLVGSVNLMSLMSARALSRRHEIAVCRALGISRLRLFRQVLLDGLVLAGCGLAAALPLAWWTSASLQAQMTIARGVPLLAPWTPDREVIVVAVLVAVTMALLMGLLPAGRAVRGQVQDAMRPQRTVAGSLGRGGRAMLVTQIALSMVLVAGAGLFAGMLSSLHANDAGFRGRTVVWTRVTPNPGDRAPLEPAYYRALIERLAAIPGVDGAVYTSYFPSALGFRGALATDTMTVTGRPELATTGLTEFVSPGFFEMFGVALERGRDISWTDDTDAPGVTVVSSSLARRLFPNTNPLGRHLTVQTRTGTAEVEVVGVAADAAVGGIRDPDVAVAFRPIMQDLSRAMAPIAHVRVKSGADATAVGKEYTRVVNASGHHYMPRLFTLRQWLDNAILQERLMAGVSMSAGALAVLLACLGIYGALAYSVAARVREFGIRMALGASREAVLRMILRDGLLTVLPGVLIGIPCALAAARLVRSELYGVTATDPATFAGAAFLFVVTGLAAALLPAHRASRADPVDALRQE